MGFFKNMVKAALEEDDREERRRRERDKYIQGAVDHFHESSGYYNFRRQIMKENEIRRRNGQPQLPVPPWKE